MIKHAGPATCIMALGLLGLAGDICALGAYRSDLVPAQSTPGNTWYDATAEFLLDGLSVDFNIRFGVESVIPTQARIDGPGGDFTFDLGTALVVIHSPGPWPDGYDGATLFYGSFDLPAGSYDAFVGGLLMLHLTGASQGDFHGPILALLGDTNGDGDIDDDDLGTAFSNYTGPIGAAGDKAVTQGDTDGDGDVDDTDLGSSFADYTGPRDNASVPEPGALALLFFAGMLSTHRRRSVE